MLPSSVRRVVSAAPQSPIASSFIASAPRAAVASSHVTLTRPGGHQRRCSSSKPSSSSSGGAKDVPGSQSVPASASSRTTEKRKRKSKDVSERSLSRKLPSVPSTQHLSQEALGLSTFFSLHRPISVTHSLPKTVTDEAFAAIFASRARSGKSGDVISTLSRAADELDGAMAKMTISNHAETDAAGDPVHKVDVQYPDGSESSVYVQLNSMAGQFLPFRPPPIPEPQSATNEVQSDADSTAAANAEEGAVELGDSSPYRVYKAMFTIEESTDPDGQVRVVAHSPQILPSEAEMAAQQQQQPRSFLERMALRQLRFEASRSGTPAGAYRSMLALSVKRRRTLKMKKKKYKKLMRRTRVLRRKLDRL